MKLALFDLDHTILDVDSDYSWTEFLITKGLLNAEEHREKNIVYNNQYIAGELDIVEYVEDVAFFLSQNSMDTLNELIEEYIDTFIKPKIRPKAIQKIEEHLKQGHEVVLSSATNDFIVNAVARALNIPKENVLACQLEIKNNAFTGKLIGTPNFQSGKVDNLNAWLADKPDVEESWGYSDSYNDKPLLDFATHAFAVTPDEKLTAHANNVGWEILDWAL